MMLYIWDQVICLCQKRNKCKPYTLLNSQDHKRGGSGEKDEMEEQPAPPLTVMQGSNPVSQRQLAEEWRAGSDLALALLGLVWAEGVGLCHHSCPHLSPCSSLTAALWATPSSFQLPSPPLLKLLSVNFLLSGVFLQWDLDHRKKKTKAINVNTSNCFFL